MLQALHLAKGVDVLPDVVLHRRREPFPATTEAQEIADGFGAVTLATGWLGEHGHTRSLRRVRLLATGDELRVFLDALPDVPAEERDQVVAQAAAYASGLPAKLLGEVPALTRLKWHLATTGRTTELVKVVRYERGKASPSIVRDPLRRYVVYPYWKDAKLDIPARSTGPATRCGCGAGCTRWAGRATRSPSPARPTSTRSACGAAGRR